jgi:predicted flap endonuclease-1-like 5' DNA nuclease
MPYTVTKLFLWGVPLVVFGGLVGWLLRSVQCRAELARLRSGVAHTPPGTPAIVVPPSTAAAPGGAALGVEAPATADSAAVAAATTDTDTGTDTDIDTAADAAAEQASAAVHAPDHEAEASIATLVDLPEPVELDLDAAAAVIGAAIRSDDLTVVEGIGPKIAELLAGIGVHTWAALGATEVGVLRTMLQDAGARYAVHDPTSWPQQARLLSVGAWEEFKALTDELDGGRTT